MKKLGKFNKWYSLIHQTNNNKVKKINNNKVKKINNSKVNKMKIRVRIRKNKVKAVKLVILVKAMENMLKIKRIA